MAQESPQYLSFNAKISPEMAEYQVSTEAELQEMKNKDPQLRFKWTIWEQISADKKGDYADSTHQVASFGTVKEFWKYWNHLPQPSELLDGKKFVRDTGGKQNIVDALMVFREGVRPEWEDATNATGGHFQFQLKPQLHGGTIDEYWNNIVLGMIGGTIEPAEMVTGVRLVDKLTQKGGAKQGAIRIEVWFANLEDTEKVDLLQKNLEKCMGTKLDGSVSTDRSWGKTEKKNHKK
jgi:translation initiation factor 4E